MLWEHKLAGKCFQNFFEFSQTSTCTCKCFSLLNSQEIKLKPKLCHRYRERILFIDSSKMPRRGSHFVNKGTLLCYSLSITEQIISNVANQRMAFVIEHQQIYTKIHKNNKEHVFSFFQKNSTMKRKQPAYFDHQNVNSLCSCHHSVNSCDSSVFLSC